MACLLNKLLEDPNHFADIASKLKGVNPPAGLDEEVWQFREELPLHLINYLRDSTVKILSCNISKQTPSKGKRTGKYDYNSPVKPVSRIDQPKVRKKEKKKVKLFPSSRSVNEGIELDSFSIIDGVGELPPTPLRQNKLKSDRTNEDRDQKKIFSKQTPSPQPFNLGDFLNPDSAGWKKSGSRSPKKTKSRIKSSTPNPESFMSRLDRIEDDVSRKLDLESKDMFPGIGEGEVKKRIKPITLTSVTGTGIPPGMGRIQKYSGGGGSGFSSSFSVAEVERQTFDERGMIKEAALITPSKEAPGITPNKLTSTSRSRPAPPLVQPDPGCVTWKEHLNLLISLYSHIILENLMPNLTVELYFLVEMFLLETGETEDSPDVEQMFSSVHNCVYFSIKVLELISTCLQYLDRCTLRQLMENPRIKSFSPFLAGRIEEFYSDLQVPSPSTKQKLSGLQNVSFQSETDNRFNFPSNTSFHDFKKQRDKFYALIRSWSDHSRGKEYDFPSDFGSQVEDVLKMHNHNVNYTHFCSLFIHQLLVMCRGEEPSKVKEGLGRNQQSLGKYELSHIQKLDPVKYARLAARLITPGQLGGPCPPPAFSGASEFFRDFILHCNSPRFLAHLKHSLIFQILKIEGKHFGVEDQSLLIRSDVSKISEISVTEDISQPPGLFDPQTNQTIQFSILTLRVLGKFLGFVEFFPFVSSPDSQSTRNLQEEDPVLLMRKNSLPSLDIIQVLSRAEREGRLCISLPWILEYLVQMDPVSHQIQYYSTLSMHLILIYQHVLKPNDLVISPSLGFFLSTYMGWLLEKEDFPRDLLILARFEPYQILNQDESSLDRNLFIPQSLLYRCCPWLAELKVLLSSPQPGNIQGEKDAYRKITPVSAPSQAQDRQAEKLQKELEENFFQNQSPSLRRTVEFVSERLASNIIKLVRGTLVPEVRDSVFTQIQQTFNTLESQDLERMSRDSVKRVQTGVLNIIKSKGKSEAESLLDILISGDIDPSAKMTCGCVVLRNLEERVDVWIKQNLTNIFFFNEFNSEKERLQKQEEKNCGRGIDKSELLEKHDPSAPTPSSVMIQLKQDIIQILLNQSWNQETSSQTLENLETCLKNRMDLTPVGILGLGSLSVDWILSLISGYPDTVTVDLVSSLLRVWRLITPVQILNLVSPTSLTILEQSNNSDQSWEKMELLLKLVLKEKLLPILALEDSCIDLIQQEWEGEILSRVGSCLERIVGEETWDGGMDWVSWFTQNISSSDKE